MSLQSQYNAGIDPAFIQLIQAAIEQQAVAISNESPTTTNHPNRIQLAFQVLQLPASYAPNFAQAVASQGVDKTATDTTILNTVSSVWNALAGVG